MRSETFSLKNVLHANKYLKRHDAPQELEHKIALGRTAVCAGLETIIHML